MDKGCFQFLAIKNKAAKNTSRTSLCMDIYLTLLKIGKLFYKVVVLYFNMFTSTLWRDQDALGTQERVLWSDFYI